MKQQRIEKTIKIMQNANIDGLLLATGANLQYLLDCTDYFWQRTCMNNIMGHSNYRNVPETVLYLKASGEYYIFTVPHLQKTFSCYPNVIITYMDQLEDSMSPYIKGKSIGVGFACFDYLKDALRGIDDQIQITEAEDLLNDIRCIKDTDEIATLRKMAEFTDEAIRHVLANLRLGMSQYEAEQAVMQYGLDHGISDLSFPPTCGFKTRMTELAKDALSFDRNTPLVNNTAIALDIGFMHDGYCSDWGRTVYYGQAPELVKKGYHALQAGQQHMVASIVPYKTNVNELYGFVLDKVRELGYGAYLRFQEKGNLGHQIGIDCHEHPMLNKEVDYILKPGMVFCSEPKMFFENECYMRVEDMILVTETGAEFLTKFDRDLFELPL